KTEQAESPCAPRLPSCPWPRLKESHCGGGDISCLRPGGKPRHFARGRAAQYLETPRSETATESSAPRASLQPGEPCRQCRDVDSARPQNWSERQIRPAQAHRHTAWGPDTHIRRNTIGSAGQRFLRDQAPKAYGTAPLEKKSVA